MVSPRRFPGFNYPVRLVYEPSPWLLGRLMKRLRDNPILQIILEIFTRLTRRRFPWLVSESYSVNERVIEVPFMIRSIGNEDGLILDVGCCESPLPLELAHLGFKVVGVDQRSYLPRHPNFHFVRADICQLSFPPNVFNLVIVLSTIEHVGIGFYGDPLHAQGDAAGVRELCRVLKPQGRLLLTAPCGKRDEGWQRVYDPASMVELLSGFQIEKMLYFRKVGESWIEACYEDIRYVDSTVKTNAVVLVEARRVDRGV